MNETPLAYSVKQFCKAAGDISVRHFYALRERGEGPLITRLGGRNVVGSIDELVREGWLETRIAPATHASGRQSILWATPELLEAVSLPEQVAHAPGELIRLRDENKILIDYRDTEARRRERRKLEGFNEGLEALDITLPGAKQRGNCLVFRTKKGQAVVNMACNQLYRVGNVDFLHGMRFYGPGVQGIPSDERPGLLFDGEPTLEADYKAIHANLAYAEAGKQPPADPYDVDGFERADSKYAFLIALNATTDAKAVGAIAEHVFAGREQPYAQAKACLAAVKAKNAPIADKFSSGAGLRYQRQDADIMENVLTGTNRRGVVAVPVHDSAIVQAKNIGVVQEEMARAAAAAGVGHMAIETKA